MSAPAPRMLRIALRRALVGVAAAAVVATTLAVLNVGEPADAEGTALSASAARKANVATPGNFTGYGFDQCHAPTQSTMNRWLQSSPFFAVGIYISGDSRACRDQPNLTPAWVRSQLAAGWRLLPITLGPQASCQPRFPRYGNDETISPRPGARDRYPVAWRQGLNEAIKSVEVAAGLGIVGGSTLWYDLEGFDSRNTRCRESALVFLSAWTRRIHKLGYVSGVYSSAGSGIAMLDDARVNRPDQVVLPDQIWIARWDGKANTTTSYVRNDGWQPHARIKQYQGGHDETWGGVRINIDRNYLDVGRGSVAAPETHCGGVRINYPTYEPLRPPVAGSETVPAVGRVKALQCLLTEQQLYSRAINGTYSRATIRAARAWQAGHGFGQRDVWSRKNWMSLLGAGAQPVLKIGSAGPAVRRLQRALNAAAVGEPVRVNGVFGPVTDTALRGWQRRVGVSVSGVAGTQSWPVLAAGKR
jgi:peptidoglycan hydrolase-like protein with peptidoglycan-binding domain